MSQSTPSNAPLARARPLIAATGVYCLAAAIIVAWMSWKGRLYGHSFAQIAPFVAHLLLNGAALLLSALFSNAATHARRKIIAGTSWLIASCLSIVGLILCFTAVHGLTRLNMLTLVLLLPAVAVWIPALIGIWKVSWHPQAAMPKRPTIRILGLPFRLNPLVFLLMLAVWLVGVEWYWTLKAVLWSSAPFNLAAFVRQNTDFITQELPVGPWVLVIFALAGVDWPFVFDSALEGLRSRLGFGAANDTQQALVQSRLQMLLDFANTVENATGFSPATLVTAVPYLVVIGVALVATGNASALASWLCPPPPPRPAETWQFVVRHTDTMPFVLFLSLFPAWSAMTLAIDSTRITLDRVLVRGLRRGPYRTWRAYSLKRRLARDIVSGKLSCDRSFDARGYLLELRQSTSRRIHILAALAVMAAAFPFWRAMTAYSRVTSKQFEEVTGLPWQHHAYRYGDVDYVYTNCFLGSKGDAHATYSVVFRGDRYMVLISGQAAPTSLDSLTKVDSLLRLEHVPFEPDDTGAPFLGKKRACVQKLVQRYGDAAGFAQIMHLR